LPAPPPASTLSLHDALPISRGDVALDFSGPGALEQAAAYVRRTGTPYLSGVTAYTPQDMDALKELAAYAPILYSANYSLGIAVRSEEHTSELQSRFDLVCRL